jgi:hypothetical protein
MGPSSGRPVGAPLLHHLSRMIEQPSNPPTGVPDVVDSPPPDIKPVPPPDILPVPPPDVFPEPVPPVPQPPGPRVT